MIILKMLSSEPSKVYFQWQGNKTRKDSPRHKNIKEMDESHNTNAQWLVDLTVDHSNLPKQDQVTITMAHIQDRVSSMKSWTARGPDMIHTYCLKKLTALHVWHAQMNQLQMDPPRINSPDHEGGSHSIQLWANNMPLHNVEAPVRHQSGLGGKCSSGDQKVI